MIGRAQIIALSLLLLVSNSQADHVVVTGGPALRKWEDYRLPDDQHDRWWANFVRASTLRIDEIRKTRGANAPIVWMIYQPSYKTRGREDHKPYTQWISKLATKRNVTLVWFQNSNDFLQALNSRPHKSVESFDFFGHSNRYAFMFDYGNSIMAASTAWLHQNDLRNIKSSIFTRKATCKSWGCHTGESMSAVWKKATGVKLVGARGATSYVPVGRGILPVVKGSWTR